MITFALLIPPQQRTQIEWKNKIIFKSCTERPEEQYDARSLYERLKEQKDKKDFEFDEAHKLSE